MPYSTRDPKRYPIYVPQVWATAITQREHTIPCTNKREANRIRLILNSYRTACRHQKTPESPLMDAMEVLVRPTTPEDKGKPDDPHKVVIRSVDDNEIAQTLRASLPKAEPPAEIPAPAPAKKQPLF